MMDTGMAIGILLMAFGLLHLSMMVLLTAGLIRKQPAEVIHRNPAGYFKQGEKARSGFFPGVTVILPVRNENAGIIACLDSLLTQDYPSESFEVIVSDDFSEDYTVERVRKWIATHPGFKLVLLEGKGRQAVNFGKKRAIERAMEIARGDIILSTDADTSRDKSWIRSMIIPFQNTSVNMVLGPVCFSGERRMFGKIQTLEFLGIMGVTAGSAHLGHPLMCNGANLAYRKSCFAEAGGYSGNHAMPSGDDQFLLMKFTRLYGGRSVVFNRREDSIVFTSPCSSWHDFWEQRLRWVSKSRAYRDRMVIAAGIITAGYPLMILAGGIAGVFMPWLLVLSAALWFLKILAEYPLVGIMAGFFEKKALLSYYFVAQVFQFFYSIVAAAAGPFVHYTWKGRNYQ